MIWLRLLGFGKAILNWAKANPLLAILTVSLAFNWLLWERGDRYRDKLHLTLSQQEKATEAQIAVNQAPATKSRAIAEKSDVESKQYYEAGIAAGRAYADRMRVKCPARVADLPSANRSAEVHDGPRDTAGMVAVTQADFELLAANSLRLAQVHEDAKALIAEGVAEPQE